MAIAQYKSGTATVSTAEYSLVTPGTTLAADATDGVYQIFIDFALMAAGDIYDITVKEKCLAASTQRSIYTARVNGVQLSLWVSPSLILMHGWDVTLKKNTGTDRSIDWSIRQVA